MDKENNPDALSEDGVHGCKEEGIRRRFNVRPDVKRSKGMVAHEAEGIYLETVRILDKDIIPHDCGIPRPDGREEKESHYECEDEQDEDTVPFDDACPAFIARARCICSMRNALHAATGAETSGIRPGEACATNRRSGLAFV